MFKFIYDVFEDRDVQQTLSIPIYLSHDEDKVMICK